MTKVYSYPGNNLKITENMSDLLEAFKEKPGGLVDVVKKHAFAIQAQAAKNAPVDTGNLKNSIEALPVDPNNWIIQDGAEYGVFQELGTSKVAAKHFLGNAAEREAEPFFADVRQALE
jgi:hypothetical protein